MIYLPRKDRPKDASIEFLAHCPCALEAGMRYLGLKHLRRFSSYYNSFKTCYLTKFTRKIQYY